MKSALLSLILIMSAPAYLHASQCQESQPEGIPQSSIPSGPPPSYESAPADPSVILTADEVAVTDLDDKAKTEMVNLLQRIYTDATVKTTIKKRFPNLSPVGLLNATRNEKEQRMKALGLILFKSIYGEDNPDVPAKVSDYMQRFFNGKAQASDSCCCANCACCCYKNFSSFDRCQSNLCCYPRTRIHWDFDEPYCSSCSIQ